MLTHRGPYIQRGRGFGSIFSSIFRSAVPALKTLGSKILGSSITKNVGKTLAQSALQGGLSLASDALDGKNVKDSFSSNVTQARRNLAKTLRKEVAARSSVPVKSPVKRKRQPVKLRVLTRPKRPKPRKSLFDEDAAEGSESE